jgi:hypothetical protein
LGQNSAALFHYFLKNTSKLKNGKTQSKLCIDNTIQKQHGIPRVNIYDFWPENWVKFGSTYLLVHTDSVSQSTISQLL